MYRDDTGKEKRLTGEAAPRGDELPQDGLGREMAHGEREDDRYQGGSTGRSTSGRAGDDLLGIDAAGSGAAPDDRSASGASTGAGAGGADDLAQDAGDARAPRGADEHAPDDAGDQGGRSAAARDGVDLDAIPDGSRRRDPIRQ
jgi:hypothetical protein